MRSSVVLPAPLRPASVSRSRRSSLNETPRSSGSPAMSLPRSDAMQTATRPMVGPVISRPAMRRVAITLPLSAVTLLAFAPVALAEDHGEGWWGETNDRVVTYAGFILIAFFPLFAFVATMVQSRLDK